MEFTNIYSEIYQASTVFISNDFEVVELKNKFNLVKFNDICILLRVD